MENPGIYRFINNRTGEVYVGQSGNIWARRANHLKELKLEIHHNKGMQEDYDNGDTFTFEVLEKMPEATREELEEREIYYIEKFNSFYEGYNQTPGGEYDKYEGRYEYGGDRLPSYKYEPVDEPELLDDCPECGGELVKRKSQYGDFAGCSNYPECDFTCSVKKVNFKPKNKPSYKSNLPKNYFNRSSIEWKTCCKCGKKYNSIAKSCPYCKSTSNKSKTKISTIKYNAKPQLHFKTEFEKFCTEKKYNLTEEDCDYLADKYDIDICKADTVKANQIIRNYLTENNQWDGAMENLFNHNMLLILHNNNINDFVPGHCPKCNGKLKRVSEFIIQCENYSECGFTCNNKYLKKNILSLSSTSDVTPSSKADLNNKQTSTIIENFYGWDDDKEGIYEMHINKVNKTSKQKNQSSQNIRNDDLGIAILVIILAIFIMSCIIVFSGAEGPISTIASLIFVGILCFACHIKSK